MNKFIVLGGLFTIVVAVFVLFVDDSFSVEKNDIVTTNETIDAGVDTGTDATKE